MPITVLPVRVRWDRIVADDARLPADGATAWVRELLFAPVPVGLTHATSMTDPQLRRAALGNRVAFGGIYCHVIARMTSPERRALGAQPETVEEFYRARFPDAVRLAHLLSGDASIAEDIAQDAFDRVRRRFDRLAAPWPYLRVAVVNGCRSLHRSRLREATRIRKVGPALESQLGARELLDAVDALPYRQKAVIVLRYYEDLSEADIAVVLGCRPGTVKSLASRALQRLSQEVQR